ncbi:ribosome maturation protein [Phlebopus sp. FC_14]|nr:ribosome maturation protein [Phlebopus sp. FC_14]
MVKNHVTKVVYKPDSQSTDEFIAIVNPVEYKKWKAGGDTIPLTEVVDSFEVFHSGQGAQGYLGRPSKQQLDNVFGTSKDVDVITILLQRGKEQAGDGFTSGTFGTNASRGSAILDNRGKGLSGI